MIQCASSPHLIIENTINDAHYVFDCVSSWKDAGYKSLTLSMIVEILLKMTVMKALMVEVVVMVR